MSLTFPVVSRPTPSRWHPLAQRYPETAANARLDAEALRFLLSVSDALIGQEYLDCLARAVCTTSVPWLADYCIVDVRMSDGVNLRSEWGGPNPEEEREIRALAQSVLVPLCVPGSPLQSVMNDLRILTRGEIGGGEDGRGTFSLLSLPIVTDGTSLGVLSLVGVDRHDRFGRLELAVAEEVARRLGRALQHVWRFEQARRSEQTANAFRQLQADTIESLEAGLRVLKSESANRTRNARRSAGSAPR